jgi:hypothetical protein
MLQCLHAIRILFRDVADSQAQGVLSQFIWFASVSLSEEQASTWCDAAFRYFRTKQW